MTEPSSDVWGDPHFEQSVRETAYFLWQQAGRPQGAETEFWYCALERKLRERGADADLGRSPEPPSTGQVDDSQDDLGRDVNDPANRIGDMGSNTTS